MYTWDELKGYIQAGEQLVESDLSHVAILVARAMDATRRAANEAEDAVEATVASTTKAAV